MLECRRRGLYQASIHSKTARASWRRVCPAVLVEQLALQGGEEALGHGVVVARRRSSPWSRTRRRLAGGGRTPRTCIGLPWSEWTDGLTLRWPPAPGRHLQGVDDELGPDVIGDGPADDPTAPGVEDDGHVDLALGGGVLGDVADPQPVGPVRRRSWRFTRSSEGVASGSRRVQPRNLRRCRPWMPARRIRRSTRLREQRTPSPRRSSAHTLGLP